MQSRVTNWWTAFATGFWFVPGLFVFGGVALAILGPIVDRQVDGFVPPVLQTTETTARATLIALCGAMFTVTGVVFSTTCVALSITSNQLGPRLLRNFLGQQVTQLTLGICLATSVYCLILLRRVDERAGTVIVPHLSLLLASVLGVVTLLQIVFFIHRVVRAMQAQNVASDVADDLDRAVVRLFPERMGDAAGGDTRDRNCSDRQPSDRPRDSDKWREAWERFDNEEPTAVSCDHDGYLQAIDEETVMRVAREGDLCLRLRVQPGAYLRSGDTLIDALPADRLSETDQRKLRGSFLTGDLRTTQQDVECAVNELVEVGVRALSPGVNDPYTAITCIDRLSGALCRMATRGQPSGLRQDDDGRLRVVANPRTFADAVASAFDLFRQHSRGDTAVTIRLLQSANAIAGRLRRPCDRAALKRQVAWIAAAAEDAGLPEHDLDAVRRQAEQAQGALETDAVGMLAAARGH